MGSSKRTGYIILHNWSPKNKSSHANKLVNCIGVIQLIFTHTIVGYFVKHFYSKIKMSFSQFVTSLPDM